LAAGNRAGGRGGSIQVGDELVQIQTLLNIALNSFLSAASKNGDEIGQTLRNGYSSESDLSSIGKQLGDEDRGEIQSDDDEEMMQTFVTEPFWPSSFWDFEKD
jgi:hypothetical protein